MLVIPDVYRPVALLRHDYYEKSSNLAGESRILLGAVKMDRDVAKTRDHRIEMAKEMDWTSAVADSKVSQRV